MILLLRLSLLIMMVIFNDFLRAGNIVIFIISILKAFLMCIFFVPFSHQRLEQCCDHVYKVMVEAYSLSFWCKWDVSWHTLAVSIFFLKATFYLHYKMHFLSFMLICITYTYLFFCQLEIKYYWWVSGIYVGSEPHCTQPDSKICTLYLIRFSFSIQSKFSCGLIL